MFKASAEETFALTIGEVCFFSHISEVLFVIPRLPGLALCYGSLCSCTSEVRVFMANLSTHEEGTNTTGSFRPRTSHGAWTSSLDFAKDVQIHAGRKCLSLSLPKVSMMALPVGTGQGQSLLPQLLIVLHFFHPFPPTLFTMTKKPSKPQFFSPKEHL